MKDSKNEPKENLKLIYKTRNEEKNILEDKRMVTKTLKMNENNQYGNAMTKPLPIGSILLSILNLTLKMRMKNNYFSTKFIHQFLRKKCFAGK